MLAYFGGEIGDLNRNVFVIDQRHGGSMIFIELLLSDLKV